MIFRISSPKRVFCHANHSRVKTSLLSLWKDSCMKPVPASVVMSWQMQCWISSSLSDVKALIMMLIGQITSDQMCGPPIPSPAGPRWK